MIEAVFLDFFGTLVKWAPDAEEMQCAAAAAEGLAVERAAIARAYPTANAYMNAENARARIAARSSEDRARFFAEYERRPGSRTRGHRTRARDPARRESLTPPRWASCLSSSRAQAR